MNKYMIGTIKTKSVLQFSRTAVFKTFVCNYIFPIKFLYF